MKKFEDYIIDVINERERSSPNSPTFYRLIESEATDRFKKDYLSQSIEAKEKEINDAVEEITNKINLIYSPYKPTFTDLRNILLPILTKLKG